jgi:endoglucanase
LKPIELPPKWQIQEIDSDTVASASSPVGYEIQNGEIVRENEVIHLKGINWFGFETPEHVVHGLWTQNYRDIILNIKTLGFNAIRLPFCPNVIDQASTRSINYYINPNLKGLNSLAVLDKIMQEANAQGLYILLDHHVMPDHKISELWYSRNYSEAEWLADLKFVANRYKGLDHFLGVDIKNEPHGSVTWGDGDPKTDWKMAAEKAAEVLLEASPGTLVFVEGIQTSSTCSSEDWHWWGENLEPQACSPLDIPKNKLVLSPHVYGPDLADKEEFSSPNFPRNLPELWDRHFGYLKKQGYAVIPGEFGGRYVKGSPGQVWQDAFMTYLKQGNMGFFYWCYNPNSEHGEGLLVHESGEPDDWETVDEKKYASLKRLMDSHH